MISLMDREIGHILDELDKRGLAENTLVVFSTGTFWGSTPSGTWERFSTRTCCACRPRFAGEDPGELRNRCADPAYEPIKARLMEQWLQAEIAREPTRFPRIAGA